MNQWDPYVDGNFEQYSDKYEWNKKPQLFFIATKHDYFIKFPFFKGSTILDPWRYIHSQKECKMILIGNSIENTKSSK